MNVISSSLSILIIDSAPVIREGLKAMLFSVMQEMVFDVQVAGSGETALQQLSLYEPDIILMEYQLTGMSGPETVRRILRFIPAGKILAISHHQELHCINEMMDAGAVGYVLKNISGEELIVAIQTILQGKKYYCNDVALLMIDAAEQKDPANLLSELHVSVREQEVLSLIVDGLTSRQIAERLFVSVRTIETHRQHLMAKLKIHNTVGLVRWVMKVGMG